MKQLFTLLIAVFITGSTFSQSISQEKADTMASITTVQGAALNGTVYLKCSIKNQKEDGFLVFEIFKDDVFQYLGSIAVSGVPVDLPMLYCFNYEDAEFKEGDFRVTCLTPGQAKIMSPVFKVKKIISSIVAAETHVEKEFNNLLKNSGVRD